MRLLNGDGSCDIQDLTYRELQRICKMLGLSAVGDYSSLRNRLEDYEEQKNITLKIFIPVIIGDGRPPSKEEYSIKVLEVGPND